MEISDLLHGLTIQGFTVMSVGCDAIEVQGPIERLTPELKQSLTEHKPALLQLLAPAQPVLMPADILDGCKAADVRWASPDECYAADEREAIQDEHRLTCSGFDPLDLETLELADYEYLWGPLDPGPGAAAQEYGDYLLRSIRWRQQRHPDPCGLCGGRLRHNPHCLKLSDDWGPVMPFGKH